MAPKEDLSYPSGDVYVKLVQLDSHSKKEDGPIVGSLLISPTTLQKLCEKERVLVWGLPLSALQRKIGESGRFCLPDKSMIDDVVGFSLYDYRQWSIDLNQQSSEQATWHIMTVYWIKNRGQSNSSEHDGSGEASSQATSTESHRLGPMREKDWDYVFQANQILNCSLVDVKSSTIKKAPYAAFRLRDSNDDYAEQPLPEDDQKAKIPVWSLSLRPARAYIKETHSELEKSSTISGHSKKSWDIGLSATIPLPKVGDLKAEGKFGKSNESSFKDKDAFGQKQNTQFTIYEIPVVELDLHEGNSRPSDACRQSLLKLRDKCRFDDLMKFFGDYGTIYSKRVVLGGRMISTTEFYQETMESTKERQKKSRIETSASLGIDPFSVKGSYSDEHGSSLEFSEEEMKNSKKTQWTAYGGNAALANEPSKWHASVAEYKYWEIIDNVEVDSIQNFIGRFPGFEDIPGLFYSILLSGTYSPETLYLGPKFALSDKDTMTKSALNVSIGQGIDVLTGEAPGGVGKKCLLDGDLKGWRTSRVLCPGSVSWRLLDTPSAVRTELSTRIQSVSNDGVNRVVVPEQLYHLSLEPRTINIVMEWSSDLIEYGLNLGKNGPGQLVHDTKTLRGLSGDQVTTMLATMLGAVNSDQLFAVDDKGQFTTFNTAIETLKKIGASIPYGSSAAFFVQSWSSYLARQFPNCTAGEPKSGEPKPEEQNPAAKYLQTSLREDFRKLPDTNFGQSVSATRPYSLTKEAITILTSKSRDDRYRDLGHGYVESYTEQAKLIAVWQLGFDEKHEQSLYELKLNLQKYFRSPRDIADFCTFVEDDLPLKYEGFSKNVSILGYREKPGEESKVRKPQPNEAIRSLTSDDLYRNVTTSSIILRPWSAMQIQMLDPKETPNPQKALAEMIPVSPKEFYILNTRRATESLLILKLYSKNTKNDISQEYLESQWTTLKSLLERSSLNEDGTMSTTGGKDTGKQLSALVEALEEKLACEAKFESEL